MKQHITVDEINKLPIKSKNKLLTWIFDHHYEIPTEDFGGLTPDLTIGMMIEFISDHEINPHFPHQEWHDYVIKEVQDCGDIQIPYTSEELCDALWEAVKEALEER